VDGIDRDDFQAGPLVSPLLLEIQEPVYIGKRFFKWKIHDVAIRFGMDTLDRYFQLVEPRVKKPSRHILCEQPAVGGNLGVLGFFNAPAKIGDSLGKAVIQQGFVHQVEGIAPNAELKALIRHGAKKFSGHAASHGYRTPRFSIRAKNTSGIASRDRLDLNILGRRADGWD
jgi:hypothetical protein